LRLCAGAYVSGAAGSNACPAGSVRIEAAAACRTAAAAAGKRPAYSFVETDRAYPRGCYYFTSSNDAYFNAHAVGAGNPATQLLCAAATTGALPPRLRFGRACTPLRDCCDGMGSSGMHVGRIGYEFARVLGSTCTGSWACRRRLRARRCALQRGAGRRGLLSGVQGTPGVLIGYSWVLTRYSRGTQMGRSEYV
jgi:hypothetical protein